MIRPRSSKQKRLVLFGVFAVIIVVFIILLISGRNNLTAKSQKLVDLKLQSKTVNSQLIALVQAKKDISQYSYFNTVAKTVIPSDKDQAKAVLEIFQLADESQIAIASITFPTSSLGSKSTSSSSTKTESAVSSTKALSQAQPVSGIPGLYSLELTITPQTGSQVPPDKIVTYPKLLDFLNRVEHNRRTAQITQVSIQPLRTESLENRQINFSLTINIFIKP